MSPVHPASGGHNPDWKQILIALGNRNTYLDLALHFALMALIWLAAWLLIRIGRIAIQRAVRPLIESDMRRNALSQAARARTLMGLALSSLRYTVWFFAIIGALASWNVRFVGLLGTALGTAGIFGVVVGFGAQKLVRDVITGFFILMEDQYAVGDTVTIGTVTGVVEDVGIRVTRIRDEVGRLNVVPNGDISQVTNFSRGGLDAVVELSFPLEQDLEPIREIVERVGEKTMQEKGSPVAGPASVQGITAMDGMKVTVRIGATAAPGQQKAAEMALRAGLREEFLAAGVKLA